MNKEVSVPELASILKGKVIGSLGKEIRVKGSCAIDKYKDNYVSFVKDEKHSHMLGQLRGAVVLIPEDLVELCKIYPQNVYILVRDVSTSLADVQDFFYSDQSRITESGIAATAKLDSSAQLGDDVYLGENVYIGRNVVIGQGAKILHNSCLLDNVVVGNGTYVYPGVCMYGRCQVGSNCSIHAGAKIGVDGFRFEQDVERKLVRKIYHAGRVIIGDRVEIGANSTIDRATFEGEATVISDDVKIDNLVHVGHNAKIGMRTLIAAQSCIGGSDRIGEDVWIGIGVTISDNVSIGDRARVLLNAVVAYDVANDAVVSGFYAMPHKQWKQVYKKLTGETGVDKQ